MKTFVTLLGALCLFFINGQNRILSAQVVAKKLFHYGDFRVSPMGFVNESSSGVETEDMDYRFRARTGLGYRFSSQFLIKARLTTLLATNQDTFQFELWHNGESTMDRATVPTGTVTFDEAYFQFNRNRHQLKIGRFQTQFMNKTNSTKSIDRLDTAHMFIGWTDGLYYTFKWSDDYTSNFIVQYNREKQVSNTLRTPLNFKDELSHYTLFGNLESTKQWMPNVIYSYMSVTFIPNSVWIAEEKLNYVAFASSAAWDFPISASWVESFRIQGNLGYAFNAPPDSVMNVGTSTQSTNGTIANIHFNLRRVFKKHDFNFEMAHTKPGWLIASAYRNNTHEWEIRHSYYFSPKLKMDTRLRHRMEADQIINSIQRRNQWDFFLRITYKL